MGVALAGVERPPYTFIECTRQIAFKPLELGAAIPVRTELNALVLLNRRAREPCSEANREVERDARLASIPARATDAPLTETGAIASGL